jgi:hypothetical protein
MIEENAMQTSTEINDKAARAAIRSKIRAGIYSVPPFEHIRSTDQFRDEIETEIARQIAAHHGVVVTIHSLPDELREEFYAFRDVVWNRFWPILNDILKADRKRELAVQAERNRDRPTRWWPRIGEFCQIAIREDGSLWNPNKYPEEAVRQAIAAAEAQLAARKQESIRRGVETRRRRREQRIWAAAETLRKGAGIGRRSDCFCCAKALTDPVSIERGIGPECWEHVLRHVENKAA